ncbi:unnamed protein product [Meloidogyne enterolobii]|uniref:Uncharacterized protein n=1 Tax=Meloidogyne enterolobii TaxID=390850 RepID=A0ACB1AQS8_MELEN
MFLTISDQLNITFYSQLGYCSSFLFPVKIGCSRSVNPSLPLNIPFISSSNIQKKIPSVPLYFIPIWAAD